MGRWLKRLEAMHQADAAPVVPPITPAVDANGSDDRDAAAIAWRVAAMRPQIPARGPIPFLMARPGTLRADAPGRCESCGEPREDGQRYICRTCQRAKWQVLNEVREDVPAAPQREGRVAA